MGKKRIKDTTKKESHLKSGKAEQARLADMGQKALEDLEKVEAKASQGLVGLGPKVETKTTGKKAAPLKIRSRRYQAIKTKIDPNKKYPLEMAVDLLLSSANAGFDESVDTHLVLVDKLTGTVSLPHARGKKEKIVIADDKVIEQIQKGKIDFDVLLATPAMMPKLARLARVLGPKGLMPNPKAGTISDKPEEVKKKLEGGQTRFKSEPKAPLLHFTLGKVSFGKEKLMANLKAFLEAVKKPNILKATICSSMGPGIKLELEKL